MIIIGDIHGDFGFYSNVIQEASRLGRDTLQIGDFGLGFSRGRDSLYTQHESEFSSNHKWFRGNHDDPDLCRRCESYLGEYGVLYNDDVKVFFVSGAKSIDWKFRQKNSKVYSAFPKNFCETWWRYEELTFAQMADALSLYQEFKPDIVLSHDCPDIVTENMYRGRNLFPSNTGSFLQALLECHAPKKWLFGHHHQKRILRIGKFRETMFQCVSINELVSVPEIPNFSEMTRTVVKTNLFQS